MYIPDKLKVGGFTYNVEFTEKMSLGNDVSAEILYQDLVIRIRPSLPKAAQEQAFIHEMIHAILRLMGHIDQSEDEKLIEELAQGLYAVVIDNKDILSNK